MANAPQATTAPLDRQPRALVTVSLAGAAPVPVSPRGHDKPIARSSRAPMHFDWGFVRMIVVASIGGVFCFWLFSRMLSWAWAALRPWFSA